MNRETYNKLLQKIIEDEQVINRTKGKNYAGNIDVLRNFKRIANDIDVHVMDVWYVYFKEHIDAITTYIKKGKVDSEGIEGRINDARIYLALLYAMVKEVQELESAILTLPTTFTERDSCTQSAFWYYNNNYTIEDIENRLECDNIGEDVIDD